MSPEQLERSAAALCDAYLDLCTTLPDSAKLVCRYSEITDDGRDVWREMVRRTFAAVGGDSCSR